MTRKLHATRNDIAENSRMAVVALLNDRLADGVDLATQLKQAHWNVKGPSFIALHELFDSLHDTVQGHVDDIAERIVALGGTARGTAVIAAGSTLPEYPLDITSGVDHVDAVSVALATFGKAVRAAIDEAAEIGDADTEDLLTGISRDTDKNLWLVEAHGQSDR